MAEQLTDRLDRFRLITTHDVANEVSYIKEVFDKKHVLEKKIVKMIKDFESETGFAIDQVHYQRDITLPIKGPKYTSLAIVITAEE